MKIQGRKDKGLWNVKLVSYNFFYLFFFIVVHYFPLFFKRSTPFLKIFNLFQPLCIGDFIHELWKIHCLPYVGFFFRSFLHNYALYEYYPTTNNQNLIWLLCIYCYPIFLQVCVIPTLCALYSVVLWLLTTLVKMF